MTEKFFAPSSVGIIGASENPQKLGYIIVKNLKESGYKGRVYPINNKATEESQILGYKSYPELSLIHEIPELVVISIPPDLVFEELMKSYSLGARNFVVITAGFKEIGNAEGEKLINEFLLKHPDTNLLGPNCLGFIDTDTPINASFAASTPLQGKISFFSQSGALCTAIMDWSDKLGMGFSKFVSLGNKNQINENTFLEERFLKNNPAFFYLESFMNGKEFISKAQKINSPLVVLHPGRFSETASAMQSHTGSIASNDRVVDEALNEAGIIRANGLEDIMDLMMIFNFYPSYREVNRVAIVSNAGGPGIITTDSVKDYGLELAKLSAETQQKLSEKLPRTANIHNPIDVVGDAMADRYGYALDIVLADTNVDAVIVLLTPQAMTQIDLTAEYIQRLAKQHGKVVLASFMGGKRVDRYEQYLFSYGIPYFDYPERAVWALSKLKKQTKPQPTPVINVSISAETTKSAVDSIRSLFLVPDEKTVYSSQDANQQEGLDILNQFRPNTYIALKIMSEQMWHKTESGGVKLKLDTEQKRQDAFNNLVNIAENSKKENPDFKYSILAQEMVNQDLELFLGAKRDANFGNTVVFGIGGIYTEILNENNLFLEYTDDDYIKDAISKTKLGKIFSGARGQQSIDLSKVSKFITGIHNIMREYPNITDIDINPLGLVQGNFYAIDIKVK